MERPRDRQQVERRALVADLVRTQATLQARSDQLQRILASRWHRLARSAWRARRRRPPVVAILLAAAALAAAVLALAAGENTGATIAGLLGALILAALAVAAAIVVPALRDSGVPRMAGEESFAQPLDDPDGAVAEAAEVRLVPAPSDGVEVDLERQRWLAGARLPDLAELRVAAILDEISQACLAPECELDAGFTLNDWRERLEVRTPHLLLVESAWAGNRGGWRYGVASYRHPRYEGLPFLRELVAWCRGRGIPTVFWNTQDPVHFDRFAAAGALFDHVFTTDANRIPAYRELQGAAAKTVEALPLAAQPRLHNPIAIVEERRLEPLFAGTYHRDRPAAWRHGLEGILDAARPFGLLVYDRAFGSNDGETDFPERFLPHIRGRLSYAETIAAYKRHRVFLNADSVTDSSTAVSRRVFELLACGTAVLSTESAAIEQTLGELVPVARDGEEANEELERLLHDDGHWTDLTRRGRRHVLAAHTYRDRFAELVATVGFDVPAGAGEETAALLLVDRREELGTAIDSLLAQSVAPNEVLLGLAGEVPVQRDLDRLAGRFVGARIRTIPQGRGASRSDRLRELARLAVAPWVAPWEPSARYGPHHLRDLVACTRFAAAEVIGAGPSATEASAGAHRYADAVPPHSALAARALLAARGWPEDEAGMRRWFSQGVRIYAGEGESRAADKAPSGAERKAVPEPVPAALESSG